MKKAFRLEIQNSQPIISAAETAGQAKAMCVKALIEHCGCRGWVNALSQIRSCRRSTNFDDWAIQQSSSHMVGEDYLIQMFEVCDRE